MSCTALDGLLLPPLRAAGGRAAGARPQPDSTSSATADSATSTHRDDTYSCRRSGTHDR